MNFTIGGVVKNPHKQIIIIEKNTRRCTQKTHNIHVIHKKNITTENQQSGGGGWPKSRLNPPIWG